MNYRCKMLVTTTESVRNSPRLGSVSMKVQTTIPQCVARSEGKHVHVRCRIAGEDVHAVKVEMKLKLPTSIG